MSEHGPFPAKVFHELTGQLDRVPFNTADARDILLIDLREHVMQSMSKLMEQRDHVIMGQQGGLIALPFSKVAHQVGHRRLKLPVVRS